MFELLKKIRISFVILLVSFAVVFSGGCGGGSDHGDSGRAVLYTYGELPDGYEGVFASADIVCVAYDDQTFPIGGAILIAPGGIKNISSSDRFAQVLKENYDGNGHIVLMSPTEADLTKLRSVLGIAKDNALLSGLPRDTSFLGIELEKDGDTHIFCHNQDIDLFDGISDEVSEGIYAARSGDIYEITSGDNLLGMTGSVDVIEGKGGRITADVNGITVNCQGLTDGTVGYIVSGDTVCKYDIERDDSEDTGDAEAEFSSSDTATAAANLRDWLLAGDNDDLAAGTLTENAPSGSLRAASNSQSDTEKNLIDLAKQYKIKLSNSDFRKSFVINQYIVACHIFENENSPTGGRDYYYIEQRGILDGSAKYNKKWAGTKYTSSLNGKKYYVGQGEVADNYIKKYEITNVITDPPEGLSLDGPPSPTATNHDNTTTSSIGWNIGAGVSGGYKWGSGGGAELAGSLSFGYSCTSTKTFNTKDVEPSLTDLNNDGSKLKWTYDFLTPQQNKSGGKWQRLYDGAALGHSTFTPTNMWIWSIPTEQRDKYSSFDVTLVPTAESKLTRNSGSISPRTITIRGTGTKLSVNLPKPPLLAIETNSVSFGNAAESKTVQIGSQGAWTAEVTEGSEWLGVTQSGRQLFITVSGNAGTSARKGAVTVTRNGTEESGVIVVTQLTTPLSQ